MKRTTLGVILFIIGILLACYVGGWLLFIQPIIGCCIAFDSGTLTALMVGITIIKAIGASAAAVIIIMLSAFIGTLVSGKK